MSLEIQLWLFSSSRHRSEFQANFFELFFFQGESLHFNDLKEKNCMHKFKLILDFL